MQRFAVHPSGSWQLAILVLSLLAVAAFLAQTFMALPEELARVLVFADWLLCAVFLGDFCWSFYRAPNKWNYMRTWGWIDLLSAIPAVEELRIGRIARVVRIAKVLWSIGSLREFFAYVFQRRAESAVAGAVMLGLMTMLLGSMAVLLAEGRDPDARIQTAEQAIWWSITTMSTVGYGDFAPVTTGGRAVAAMLMLVGVGLFGTLSGLMANLLLGAGRKAQQEAKDARMDELMAKLDRLEQVLKERGSTRE